ncbi:MAG: glycosyl transferase family 1 [Methyloligella sp.]|nr:MAG: glycosyl transferase family 1 [Methyloligella sp.]
MKILFCIKELHNASGGAERVLTEVASKLAERNHEVYILSCDSAEAEQFYPLHENIKWIKLGSEEDSAKSFKLLRHIIIMRRFIKKLQPEIAIGFMHSMYIPLGFSLLGTSVPVIASEHIVPEHYRCRPWEWGLLHLTPFMVKKITCVSKQVKDAFAPFLNKKMIVVPNPVFVKDNIKANLIGNDNDRKTMLTIGRLDKQKDHKVLIEAFSKIASEFPEWDLKIIGEGELRTELEKQIKKNGLTNRIFLPGRTRNVSHEYENAQLFVLPSRYESFGLTLVEAMSHGLPTIGFDYCLGVNQLIKHNQNGILVDSSVCNLSGMTNALKQLMGNSELRIKLGGFSSDVFETHKLATVVDQWETLLKSSINHTKK